MRGRHEHSERIVAVVVERVEEEEVVVAAAVPAKELWRR